MITKQFIKIEFDGTMEERDKYFRLMAIMLNQGVFKLKNGKAVLSFDSKGELREIQFDIKKWSDKYGISEIP